MWLPDMLRTGHPFFNQKIAAGRGIQTISNPCNLRQIPQKVTQNSRNAEVPIVHSQGTQFTVQLVRPFSACRRQGGSHGQCFQLVLDWGCGIKETMMISSNFMAFICVYYIFML